MKKAGDCRLFCFLNGVLVGSGTLSASLGVLDSFFVGGVGSAGLPILDKCCYGAMVELKMTDFADKPNSRQYEFVLTGTTNGTNNVRGRSPVAGLEYQVEAYCSGSVGNMFSGIGSGAAPYGTQAGDYCYVTILETGSAVLSDPSWLGNRYQCRVEAYSGSTSKAGEFRILTPTGVTKWITAGNMSTVKVRVEYTANPPMDAEQVNITWMTSEPKGPVFDGTTWIDIPPISTPRDFAVKVIRTGTSAGDMYILDGRTNVNTTNGYLIVDTAGRLTTTNENTIAGDFSIDTVNGEPYAAGVVLELNKPYVIVGRAPRMARIGARYDGAQGFVGRIWDVNLEDAQTKKLQYWPGVHTTPFVSHSTTFKEESLDLDPVYQNIDINLMTRHANTSLTSRNKITFTAGGVSTGCVDGFGLSTGDRFRVVYDITSDVPIDLHCASVLDSSAPVIKSLPAGRNSGSVSYQHTAGVAGPGVYIKAVNPVVGSSIQINRFDVFRGVKDGICNKKAVTNTFTKFPIPNLKIQTKKIWAPAFGVGFIDIPTWKPDPNNFRIHVRAVVGAASENMNTLLSGSQFNVSGIYLDTSTDSKRVRVFGYNAAGVAHSLYEVAHSIPVGSVVDIDVLVLTTHNDQGALVKNRELTLSISDGKAKSSVVGVWGGDGSESIKFIGYRPTIYRYNADIHLVELIDTGCLRWNTRQYDLTRIQNSKPTNLSLQYDLEFPKMLKIGQGVGYKGWDNTIYPQVGFFKDTHYVDGNKLVYIKSSSSVDDVRLKFEGGKQPFGLIVMEVWGTKAGSIDNELVLVDSFDLNPTGSDAAGTVEYLSGSRPLLVGWWSDTNAYKKIVIKPTGIGSNVVLTNFPAGAAWRQTTY
jgi:hypothetical protein